MIALTTSTAGDDVEFSYDVGVNAYVTKPTSFSEWIKMIDVFGKYWFEVVEVTSQGVPWWKNALGSCWSRTIPTTFG